MVILGGAGSQAGVVLGAIADQRPARGAARPGDARGLFYVVDPARRSSPRSGSRAQARASSSAARSCFGFVARFVAGGDRRRRGPPARPTAAAGSASWASDWVIVPDAPRRLGRAGRVRRRSSRSRSSLTLVRRLVADRRCSCRPSTSPRSSGRTCCSPQPESTRYIVLGAMLVALMIARPQGLLGEKRVEIV